jgi:hypothetical protein
LERWPKATSPAGHKVRLVHDKRCKAVITSACKDGFSERPTDQSLGRREEQRDGAAPDAIE